MSSWVTEKKQTYLESVGAARLTTEEACAAFRRDIRLHVALAVGALAVLSLDA